MSQFGDIFKYLEYDKYNMLYEICTLTKQVGDYGAGHSFYNIIFVPTEGTLEFYESVYSDVPTMVKKLIID